LSAAGPGRIIEVVLGQRSSILLPRRLAAAVAWLGLVAVGVAPALAQGSFDVTYQVDRSDPARVQLVGRVHNGAAVDAIDVYVTAEARDASGKILARGIAFVAQTIPSRSAAEFSARVPAVPGTASFRVVVSSFRYGIGRGESP